MIKIVHQKTGNRTFFQPKLICQFVRIHMNFFRFFSNLRNFLLVFTKRSKVAKFGYDFATRLRTALKKYLNNRLKRFANSTQKFVDKRSFQKLEKIWKNSYVFGKIDNQFWLKKVTLPVFLLNNSFHQLFC